MTGLKRDNGRERRTGRIKNLPPPGEPSPNPADEAAMIRVLDAAGRELQMSRQQWRDSFLLANIQQSWDDPHQLAVLIRQALADQFYEEMVKPVERLAQIDPQPERGALLQAIVYLKNQRPADAERILQGHLQQHGESGAVLTCLANLHAERGEQDRALATLERALQLDPNQEDGLAWYQVIHRERGGDQARLQALGQIAALRGSWRAQLWLARAALERRDLPEALRLYRESLAAAGQPVPGDLLLQMSGDLGRAGHVPELVQLTLPHFQAPVHGLHAGNNLIKALLDLGQREPARAILDQLQALNRPDWKPTLAHWESQLAQATGA